MLECSQLAWPCLARWLARRWRWLRQRRWPEERLGALAGPTLTVRQRLSLRVRQTERSSVQTLAWRHCPQQRWPAVWPKREECHSSKAAAVRRSAPLITARWSGEGQSGLRGLRASVDDASLCSATKSLHQPQIGLDQCESTTDSVLRVVDELRRARKERPVRDRLKDA